MLVCDHVFPAPPFHRSSDFQLKLFMSTCLRAHSMRASLFPNNSVGTFRFIIQQFQHINQNVTRRRIFLDACELAIVLITIYVAKWQYFSISWCAVLCACFLSSLLCRFKPVFCISSYPYTIKGILKIRKERERERANNVISLRKYFTILAFPFVYTGSLGFLGQTNNQLSASIRHCIHNIVATNKQQQQTHFQAL